MSGHFEVVKRDTIPPIRALDRTADGVSTLGEFRDFRHSEELRHFLKHTASFALRWVALRQGEHIEQRFHSVDSLMLVYEGSGEAFGDLCRPLRAGDVLVIPTGCTQGFTGGPTGLHALTIEVGQRSPNAVERRFALPEDASGLRDLLSFNETCATNFSKRAIFELLTDDTLSAPGQRKRYFDAMQSWMEKYLSVLIARQAGSGNQRYAAESIRHLQQALNSGVTAVSSGTGPTARARIRDARLDAFAGWFAYQMYLLDDVEAAAIVHLVLERGRSALWQAQQPAIGRTPPSRDGEALAHGEADILTAIDLLRHQSPKTYTRLQHVVGEAWDMLGALTDRIVELTRSA